MMMVVPMKMRMHLALISIAFIYFKCVLCENKYSPDMNFKKIDPNIKRNQDSEIPFRMYKVNLLWEKARLRLAPEKLKNLYSDLKLQDKDEITLKKLKSEGGDTDGLKEAEIRKRFRAIMEKYGLAEQYDHVDEAMRYRNMPAGQHSAFNEATEDEIAKRVFKDKKLNKLWEKAERSGFSEVELKTLQEELRHHQDKLDEYHTLIDKVHNKMSDENFDNSLDRFQLANELENIDPSVKNSKDASKLLKEKHAAIKESYEKISSIAASLPNGGFEEIRVQELWQLARKSNFSEEELESIKEELHHYENRIKKLKHLQLQVDFHGVNEDKWLLDHNPDERKHLEQRIKQYSHKVDKIHSTLHSRITERHNEL